MNATALNNRPLSPMRRHLWRCLAVGIASLVTCNLLPAYQQASSPAARQVEANLIFFPYPVAVSIKITSSAKRSSHRYHFNDLSPSLDVNTLSNSDTGPGSGWKQQDRAYQPALPLDASPTTDRSRDEPLNPANDWHFNVSPQLGANHEGEKSVTFSIRRGF